jgi:hypothetical protein
LPRTPARGSNFSTGGVMCAELLFMGYIGAGKTNLRGQVAIVAKCASGHGNKVTRVT